MGKHRDGDKFGGTHTSYIEVAIIAADIAHQLPEVSKIIAGIIKNGKSVAGGDRRVKIVDIETGLLLTVRQNRSIQEVFIITSDPQKTKLALAKGLRNKNIQISFGSQMAVK